jgi:hypothetical protein
MFSFVGHGGQDFNLLRRRKGIEATGGPISKAEQFVLVGHFAWPVSLKPSHETAWALEGSKITIDGNAIKRKVHAIEQILIDFDELIHGCTLKNGFTAHGQNERSIVNRIEKSKSKAYPCEFLICVQSS